MQNNDYRKIIAITEANRKRWLKVNSTFLRRNMANGTSLSFMRIKAELYSTMTQNDSLIYGALQE